MGVFQHVGDQVGGQARFFVLETTCRHRRSADAYTAGDEWFFWIVGYGVFVDRHVRGA